MARESSEVRLVLIPAGKTEWSTQQRIQGAADLPLSEQGTAEVTGWLDGLAGLAMTAIYSSKSGPAAETAKLISKALRVKRRANDGLGEVNLGLWQGMQIAELKAKQPSVFKQWRDQPERVVPPSGESFADAQSRLAKALAALVGSCESPCIGVVLGTFSLALMRRVQEDRAMREVWDLMAEPARWHDYLIRPEPAERGPKHQAEKGA